MGHIHAAAMAEYAKDAAETDMPWERWEYKVGVTEFKGCLKHPEWNADFKYRRKPKTITVNGIEVPEPAREAPKMGEKFFFVDLTVPTLTTHFSWVDDAFDRDWLKRGLIHSTKEAAIAHAKAILAPSQRD